MQKWPMEKVYRFWNHTKYVQSDFLLLDFYISWGDKFVGYVPLNWSLHILSFTLQKLRNTSMGMYVVSIATLFWPPCLNPSFHTKSTFKKCDFVGFCISMDWNNGVNSQGCKVALNCQRNNLVVGVFNLWKPLEYLHMFTNCNTINQQNP